VSRWETFYPALSSSGRLGPIEQGLEHLVGSALFDADLAGRLLHDPGHTALAFGLAPAEAARIADLRAPDLVAFARAMSERLYGVCHDGAALDRAAGS
jgi:hypothetical protein